METQYNPNIHLFTLKTTLKQKQYFASFKTKHAQYTF